MTEKIRRKEIIREKTLQMRVSDEEYEIINNNATKFGLSTSDYMRILSLHAEISVKVDKDQLKKK